MHFVFVNAEMICTSSVVQLFTCGERSSDGTNPPIDREHGGSIPATQARSLANVVHLPLLCLSEETVKAIGSFFMVLMPWEVKKELNVSQKSSNRKQSPRLCN